VIAKPFIRVLLYCLLNVVFPDEAILGVVEAVELVEE